MHSLGWIAALAPLAAAGLVLVAGAAQARWIALLGTLVSFGASLAILNTPVAEYNVGRMPMVLFAALAVVTVLALPKQDCRPRDLAGLLLLTAGTLTVYAAEDRWLLLGAYVLSSVVVLDRKRPYGSILLAASCVALAASLALGVFWLLIAAVVLRKGMFPVQSSVTSPFEGSHLGTAALLFNGHLGAFLMVRLTAAGPDREWLPLVGTLALVAAVIVAVCALIETRPRRVLALVASSQAGCILAGLASSTPEGIQGALMQWIVVGLSSTGLLLICRLVEVRYGGQIDGREYLGLAERFPRLAVFFAACGLAMVGLPGTLGFLAEDLLVHGVMDTHSYIGILQPLAAGLNAITLLRLFSALFLGRRVTGLEVVPDALPRERWPLAALVVLLVLGGMAPSYITRLDSPAVPTSVEQAAAR